MPPVAKIPMTVCRDFYVTPTDVFTSSVLDRLVQQKKVRRKWHPRYSHLAVYKYAAGYEFVSVADRDKHIVEQCRGLVYDHDAERILCRGMPKFYNHFRYSWPELDHLFELDYEVQEKVDGSCVLLWHFEGKWHFSTLGSFETEQANKAQIQFSQMCGYMIHEGILNPGHSYVFEVVYSANRIVLDYGREEKLVYLCEFDNLTGKECYTSEFECVGEGVEVAGQLTDHMTLEELIRSVERDEGKEGYVVRFESPGDRPDIRVKFKTKWYFNQTAFFSRIRQQGLVKTLSEYYKAGRTVPRTRDLCDSYVCGVQAAVDLLVADVLAAVTGLDRVPTRKEQAAHILDLPIPDSLKSALFAGLDGKEDSVRFMVWKTLECESALSISSVSGRYGAILSRQGQEVSQ